LTKFEFTHLPNLLRVSQVLQCCPVHMRNYILINKQTNNKKLESFAQCRK